jgi:cytochrome c oxidase subunit 1
MTAIAEPIPRRTRVPLPAKLRAPGWYRAALFDVLGFAFGFALTCIIRIAMHQHPVVDAHAITIVCLITVPIFFLIGIGTCDYWFYWMSGRPTRPEEHSNHGAYTWRDYFKVNTDHKVIGVQYVVTSFFFLLVGGMLAMLIRAQLAKPGMNFVTPEQFNGLFSVHATILIFLFVIPVFAGLANYVLPLMIGAPDMAFPRLNALSYWMLPAAGIMLLMSFLAPGGAFASGWTAYAPLSTTMPLGQLFFTLGIQFAGFSSIATALNFLVTIITMRAPGMSFFRLPLLVWANFSTSLLVVIATPFIAASQFMVLLDVALHFNFFNALIGAHKNGNVLLYQNVFWFYSHPAVYIMILPGFGIISEIIAVKSRKPIFGYRMMAFSLLAIVVLGFTVWAHHMFVSGMPAWIRIPMEVTTCIIALPTGIKVFSWLATLWRGVIHLDTAMLFALGFLTTFSLGGISGIMLAMIPFDIHVSQTYFIVAHIHYVLYGGSLFTIFAGVYYWFPKMTGRMYDDRLGKLHFWSTFVFFNLTFGPMHIIGIEGMPRRVADYAAKYADWNLIISIMSWGLGLSTLIFVYNMVASWRGGPPAVANPWRGLTLEWQVSSPPPIFKSPAEAKPKGTVATSPTPE